MVSNCGSLRCVTSAVHFTLVIFEVYSVLHLARGKEGSSARPEPIENQDRFLYRLPKIRVQVSNDLRSR